MIFLWVNVHQKRSDGLPCFLPTGKGDRRKRAISRRDSDIDHQANFSSATAEATPRIHQTAISLWYFYGFSKTQATGHS
ncbi:hypothetical protein ACPOL_4337 [Acidisarcina polymorpha]|uniref:Uncharacterized protein n=1 Tax=Acidisarcina polymorpha TaxID=2211140 RepID=A0A2Z5G3C8_9BACT|nr:hypothetical protein ACPOL_4337 [Acidisarcina polymorpha]